jgi:hypothetical protein
MGYSPIFYQLMSLIVFLFLLVNKWCEVSKLTQLRAMHSEHGVLAGISPWAAVAAELRQAHADISICCLFDSCFRNILKVYSAMDI